MTELIGVQLGSKKVGDFAFARVPCIGESLIVSKETLVVIDVVHDARDGRHQAAAVVCREREAHEAR
jgi:hypothetical protein